MEATDLSISLGSWLLALAPIVVLLILMAVRRGKAPQAGPIGMFAAAAVAILAFRTPWETLAITGAKGVWDAISPAPRASPAQALSRGLIPGTGTITTRSPSRSR